MDNEPIQLNYAASRPRREIPLLAMAFCGWAIAIIAYLKGDSIIADADNVIRSSFRSGYEIIGLAAVGSLVSLGACVRGMMHGGRWLPWIFIFVSLINLFVAYGCFQYFRTR